MVHLQFIGVKCSISFSEWRSFNTGFLEYKKLQDGGEPVFPLFQYRLSVQVLDMSCVAEVMFAERPMDYCSDMQYSLVELRPFCL